MKLMRLILILLMIFLCSNTVYADQIIAPIASVVLDTDTDSLEVTGYNISDEDCNITIEILAENVSWERTSDDSDGIYFSDFDAETDSILDYLFCFGQVNNIASGQPYSFTAYGYTSDSLPKLRVRFGRNQIEYFDADIIEKFQDAQTAEELKAIVCSNDYLWTNIVDAYNDKILDQQADGLFWSNVLTEKISNAEENNGINSVNDILSMLNTAVEITVLQCADTSQEIATLLKEYFDADRIDSNSYDIYAKQGDFSDADYMSESQKEKLLLGLAEKSVSYSRVSDFISDFSVDVVLQACNDNVSKYYVRKIILQSDCISDEIAEKYGKLTESKQLQIAASVNEADSVYASIRALENAINKLLEKKIEPVGGGGGGGGSNAKDNHVGSVTTQVPAIEKTPVFRDLTNVSWASEAICALAENGIVSGDGMGNFMPEKNVTREEFVKMLVCALNLHREDAVSDFADVEKNSWSYPYISSAVATGLIMGIDENNFGTGRVMKREEMAVVIYRAMKTVEMFLGEERDDVSFVDEADISPFAKEACVALAEAGVMEGVGNSLFVPSGTVNRAQAAKVIYELIGR